MKFGKSLRDSILKEWRFYAVDYKELKGCLKKPLTDEIVRDDASVSDSSVSSLVTDEEKLGEFRDILETSKEKLSKFYFERENWAIGYMNTLEERVEELRKSAALAVPPSPPVEDTQSITSSISSESLPEKPCEDDSISESSPTNIANLNFQHFMKHNHQRNNSSISNSSNSSILKEEYRRVGKSDHFQKFIYAKKSLSTFDRELDLLLEFLQLNLTAFSKIYKKYDKRTGSFSREESMKKILSSLPFLKGKFLSKLQERVAALILEVDELKPTLPEGWENRKVYTIGCFDLFHRGHQNVLLSLREFGYYIVAGIHDDESYFKLKNKYTIDNLETRMKNVKPFVDQLFVIPSTDPLLYVQGVVSDQDIEAGSCCYARGDDMLNFPGREWIESVMPVHFVPRTESCSSTLIRTIYHAEDESLRKKAAFAKTRYDGKPVDDNGNILKLSPVSSTS